MRFNFAQPWQRWLLSLLMGVLVAIAIGLSQSPSYAQDPAQTLASNPETIDWETVLPVPRVHPLPTPLAQWYDPDDSGDYFDEIQPTELGYLVWSDFPVAIAIEYPDLSGLDPTFVDQVERDRIQRWQNAVERAIADWNSYIPLQILEESDPNSELSADILIRRETPPLRQSPDQPLRARSAETRYEFQLQVTETTSEPGPESALGSTIGIPEEAHQPELPRLSHRYTITITPNQTDEYTEATARHELGHALGIWGHSPIETDALYAAQVHQSPPISARDVNTLKRIYEQPTQLGWPLRSLPLDW